MSKHLILRYLAVYDHASRVPTLLHMLPRKDACEKLKQETNVLYIFYIDQSTIYVHYIYSSQFGSYLLQHFYSSILLSIS